MCLHSVFLVFPRFPSCCFNKAPRTCLNVSCFCCPMSLCSKWNNKMACSNLCNTVTIHYFNALSKVPIFPYCTKTRCKLLVVLPSGGTVGLWYTQGPGSIPAFDLSVFRWATVHPGPCCVEFACSPCAPIGVLITPIQKHTQQLLWLPPASGCPRRKAEVAFMRWTKEQVWCTSLCVHMS